MHRSSLFFYMYGIYIKHHNKYRYIQLATNNKCIINKYMYTKHIIKLKSHKNMEIVNKSQNQCQKRGYLRNAC